MQQIQELFVSYMQVDDKEPELRLLEDREILEVIKHEAPLFNQISSIINVESINPSDPVIIIACVMDHFLRAGESEAITQVVVEWLKHRGQI